MNIDWAEYYWLVDNPPKGCYDPDGCPTYSDVYFEWRAKVDAEYKRCADLERHLNHSDLEEMDRQSEIHFARYGW